ncbi:amino acid ABC transporter permease [Paenibacillus sp. KN14-4R]|uniref:amino acid ABC transporter permease n=1 Tax=Paenibacillus sp. KN14-4R TaxID=3445773 RepID=UPI003F9F1339
MNFDVIYMLELLPSLLKYLPLVLFITILAFILSVLLGLLFTSIIKNKVKIIHPILLVIISYFRGTPSLIQIFIFYFGIPQLIPAMKSMDAITAVIIALSLRNASFLSEVFRSAFASVDKGQAEAALSVGMTRWQTLRRVDLPQATRTAIPPTGNYFIMIFKETSLAFTIGVTDMLAQAKLEAAVTYKFLEAFLAVGLIYWVVTVIFSYIQSRIELRIEKPYR